MEGHKEEKEWYTTGEVAKILGVSFRTIKRWIYSGKISTTKTAGGHYRISKEGVERLRSEVEGQFATDIITFIERRKIAYLREAQLNMEDQYSHHETSDKFKWLVKQGKIETRYELKRRWYFPKNSWEEVKDIAEEKLRLVEIFETYERKFERDGIKYQDYSEYIVEQAMIRAGYTVVAKDSYYFNGIACILQTGPGSPQILIL